MRLSIRAIIQKVRLRFPNAFLEDLNRSHDLDAKSDFQSEQIDSPTVSGNLEV